MVKKAQEQGIGKASPPALAHTPMLSTSDFPRREGAGGRWGDWLFIKEYYCLVNQCNLPFIRDLNIGKPINKTKTIKTP